jgi:hypothetical protein
MQKRISRPTRRLTPFSRSTTASAIADVFGIHAYRSALQQAFRISNDGRPSVSAGVPKENT